MTTEHSAKKTDVDGALMGGSTYRSLGEQRLSPGEERFEKGRRTVGLFLAPVVAVAFLVLPMNIPPQQQTLAGVLLGVIEAGMFKVQWDKGIFPQAWVDEVHKALAIKRWGQPEEIGHAAVFLASNKSAYITGQRISVAGGFGLGGMQL